ncbi:MAG: hypothetical protein OMM_03254 [Candidatus Magnetoglobus multicellularis str. Araruama]|uniref:Uncharacterized protein n=1 Tax=Candidatus Magnetoglobus multicellularis str. Araruama TaxID=890399 RepID=A0A1V1P6L4_9BACT|nr:MAG: hypothetical protein OMM_03254 [Candidatus Magnetoglobus multicellularis str. Araruama]
MITGGAGGLGLIFAKEIISQAKDTTLILTGRSPINEELISELGVKIEYRQTDVSRKKDVVRLIDNIIGDFGKLDGIIHSAGVIRDNFIIKKSSEEFREVLAPKVTGLVNLHESIKDLPLDFFILFSSGSGALGNVGQADYSCANAFMDAYARYHRGKILSVNWPLWKDGGMKIDEASEKMMLQITGMAAMETENGIRSLYRCIASDYCQVMVMEGRIRQMRLNLSMKYPVLVPEPSKNVELDDAEFFEEKVQQYLKNLLSPVIGLASKRIRTDVPMEEYGIDSIMVMELTDQLEEVFGTLSKTLFFEYKTINELADYLLKKHSGKLLEMLGDNKSEAVEATDSKNEYQPVYNKRRRFSSGFVKTDRSENKTDIAIIGLTGRYPKASNINELRKILKNGVDCITEIPKNRWDHSLYFDSEKGKKGKTYCKWGGFIDDVDRFDPLFFNISPSEAAMTDPQERLFLECVWNLLEEAGYTRESLQNKYDGKVGVFAGAMYQYYHAFDSDITTESAISLLGFSDIANRVSYFFNFQGPSVATDTMCSSAGVSIHYACESLKNGHCKVAIAGGVNLTIHPKKYIGLSHLMMLGSHPDSRSFADGDGYLPSEGVGAVLLKPLEDAVNDHDNILAVIKSTAINHGGRSNGYFVPNPNAQAQLIVDNFNKSGIDPRTVTYVEASANGSALGDPIEISGQVKAFKNFTPDQQFCSIGSVKSNMGHLESVSAMAQLSKVILQFQDKQLFPSIKVYPLNPNIDFDGTPFYLQKNLSEWKRPVIKLNGKEQECPRRATVSSFGAGGSNAHLILEEYVADENESDSVPVDNADCIAVFSAKNQDCLQTLMQQMYDFIDNHEKIPLPEIIYTLQTGREAMQCRIAMVVDSRNDLLETMKACLAADDRSSLDMKVFWGNAQDSDSSMNLPGKMGEDYIRAMLAERNMEKLADFWSKGGTLPWESLYDGKKPKHISLPTYPFEKKHCWIETEKITDSLTN